MLAIVMAVSILGMSTVEPAEAAPIVIYVSPNGNDATSGIWTGRPVRTPQRARELVRALTPAMNRDIVVSLADGTYPMTSPLALDVRDSGNNGHNVVWKAAPGARPVLSGGVRITGWTRSGDMWSAPVPPGLRTRQFYVNGVRAQRASGPLPVKVKTISKGYETDTPVMDNWRNPKDIEFVYREGLGGWTVPRCPVAAISPTQITMAQPCWDNTDKRLPRTSSQAWNLVGRPKLHVTPTAVENAFELLDSPGEWYLDSALNKVFYRPRPGEDLLTANVVVPVLESLLSVTGTASDPVHNVVFDGLQFSYATWLQPSTPDGFSEVQATYTLTGAGAGDSQGLCSLVPGGGCPYGAWSKTPGGVRLSYVRDVAITGSVFAHLGGTGLDLGRGTQRTLLRGNVFTDISGNGVQLGEVDNPGAGAAERASDNRIENNHLYGLPVEFHGGVAIDVAYAENTTIAHNQLNGLAYTGISVGWGGWLDKISQPGLSNYSRRNTVDANLVFDHMLVLNDGGGVYVNGAQGTSMQDGMRISGNVIHDENGQPNSKGIYTDNGASYITITANGLYDNPIDWTRRHRNWGGDTTYNPYDIIGNYWMRQPPETTGGGVTIEGNTVITTPAEIPAAIMDNAGLQPPFTFILTRTPMP
ncbi:right-handed parallel beta-helix repeat-containing protein [Kibdelosporangium lantanae]|uniref:Right-handed parallel beta-helix repeat-containing protein n=1 Tax=Kibdelosporangium lantanae TaxID=1497396 RepID=A0ABW3M6S7_9PSEU